MNKASKQVGSKKFKPSEEIKAKKIKKESTTPEKIAKQEKTTETNLEKERMTTLLNRIDKVKAVFNQPPRPWVIDELEIFVGAVENDPKISMNDIKIVLASRGYLREYPEVHNKYCQLFEK